MSRALRIVVADDEPDMQDYFRTILPRLGHSVVGVAHNGRELVNLVRQTRPDLAITDIRMPELDGIDAARQLYAELPVPFILVSAYHDPELIRRAEVDPVHAYLVKPIKQADLEPAIAVAMHRFEQFRMLQQESADLRQALEDRKLLERAKGVLMKKTGLDEAAAYRRMQRIASDHNLKLVAVAQMLLTAEEAFSALGPPPDGGP